MPTSRTSPTSAQRRNHLHRRCLSVRTTAERGRAGSRTATTSQGQFWTRNCSRRPAPRRLGSWSL
eukprot:7995211-Alexandrium_andersonii.AAC.1